MSVARSVPELSRAKIAALDERDGEREAQVGVGREAGDVRSSRRARPCSPRAGTAGRPATGRSSPAGAASAGTSGARPRRPGRGGLGSRRDRLRLAGSRPRRRRPPPRACGPVLSRKTSSSVGWWSCRSASSIPAASSSRSTPWRPLWPGARRTETASPSRLELRAALAEAAHHLDEPVAVGRIGGHRLDGRLADLGLELPPACPRRRSCRGR